MLDVSRYLLKESRELRKMRKNTNVPKFLVRVYMKYYNGYVQKSTDRATTRHFSLVASQLRKRDTNSFRIMDVLDLLGPNKPINGL